MDSLLPDLMETGTRYQHYMELVDIFSTGIEIISNLPASLITESDKKKRVELEHAVARIEARMDVLSKFQMKQAGMRTVIEFGLPKLPKEEPPKEETCQA
jgi:hypothetical protein